MPGCYKPIKYPWSKLAVGESVDVYDVPSMASVYSSLRHWRDRSFRLGSGLGYSVSNCPQFRLEHHSTQGRVRITRLPDGPLQSVARVQRAEEQRAKWTERTEKSLRLDRLEWELSNAREDAANAKLPLPLPSAELMSLARELNPYIAQQLACLTDKPVVPNLDDL